MRGSGRIRAAARALRGETALPEPTTPERSLDQAIETLAAASTQEVQARGYHFQKRDYYSALNDLPFLVENPDLWHDRPLPRGIEWDIDAQLDQVRQIAAYLPELENVPMDLPPGPPRYHWDNAFWRGADALVHYGLLRQGKPNRVVERGAGWSSLLMAAALNRNREEGCSRTDVSQIEPYPREELLSALPAHWTLHDAILQRADLGIFDSLESGDVCFYDGSHVARAGSDVVWFFFEVLPRLKPGVLVHIHDIFWPADYPDEWIFERGQTWNEQYVAQAFLMCNREFEPLICNSALRHFRGAALDELYREMPDHDGGVSLWLRRRHEVHPGDSGAD
jgi:hypothetical protein